MVAPQRRNCVKLVCTFSVWTERYLSAAFLPIMNILTDWLQFRDSIASKGGLDERHMFEIKSVGLRAVSGEKFVGLLERRALLYKQVIKQRSPCTQIRTSSFISHHYITIQWLLAHSRHHSSFHNHIQCTYLSGSKLTTLPNGVIRACQHNGGSSSESWYHAIISFLPVLGPRITFQQYTPLAMNILPVL